MKKTRLTKLKLNAKNLFKFKKNIYDDNFYNNLQASDPTTFTTVTVTTISHV
jgi:hypothetical protein